MDGTADLFIRDRQLQLFIDFMDRYIRFLQNAVFDDFFDVVGTEVIHHNDVFLHQCRNQIVLQIIYELLSRSPSAVGRIVRFAVYAYGREDRCAFRRVQRDTPDNALSSLRPPVCAGHIRIDPAFVQKA